MSWRSLVTIGPMQWGRRNPYSPIEATVIGSELLRFRQSFDSAYRPWRAGILVEAYHVQDGFFHSTWLRLAEGYYVREFPFPASVAETGGELYMLFVSPRGRWKNEANWMLEVEFWLS